MAPCPVCHAENAPVAQTCGGCGRSLPLAPGTLIASRFEILDSLGQGGMGTVYRVRDHTLEETVALKVLRADLVESDTLARRFRSEIKVARRVGHRNVCRVFEYGEDGPLRYIAMELVDGVNLRHLVSHTGALPLSEAFETALQAVSGLEAIHDLGVVHRDIKSANIMRDRRGVVKLMDFGIARPHSGGDVTATGMIVGTPEYISPEQATGDKVDGRSDIYSMGVVIHELFTGVVPFRGDTPVATILKHVQEPLTLTDTPGLPVAVCTILHRCLAKHPKERYASARELLRALEAARDESLGEMVTDPKLQALPPEADQGPGVTRTVETARVTPRVPAGADLTLRPSATQPLPQPPTSVLPAPPAAPTPASRAPWLLLGAALGLAAVLGVVAAAYWKLTASRSGAGGTSVTTSAASETPASVPALTPTPAPAPTLEAAPTPEAGPGATPRLAPPPRDLAREIGAQLEQLRRLDPESAHARALALAGRYPDSVAVRDELAAQRQRLVAHWVTKGRETLGQALSSTRPSEELLKRSAEHFDRALELDPANADARSGKDAAARGPARAPASREQAEFELTDTSFMPPPLAAAPPGMGQLPPGTEVHAAQPPAPKARVVIEVEPQKLRPGDPYVVRYFLLNQSGGPLKLMAASVKNVLGSGDNTGGTVQPRNKLAAPNARTLLVETRDTWRQDPSLPWSTTLMVVLEDASVYSGALRTRR